MARNTVEPLTRGGAFEAWLRRPIRCFSKACVLILLASLVGAPSKLAAQSAATAAEVFEKAAQTQKVKVDLESQMRVLRGQLDSELYKLKAWAASNALGRPLSWPMVVARVEMG